MEENKTQNVQGQKDNTPKWQKIAIICFAVGSCSTIFVALIGLFGDAPGQCIKNSNYTRNYQKRLDADFSDMVRRDQYYSNRKYNG